MPTRTLRTIIESKLYESQRQALEVDARRLDEALLGTTWALARDPEIGAETGVPTIRALGIRAVGGLPELLIFYTWDEATVVLLSIMKRATSEAH